MSDANVIAVGELIFVVQPVAERGFTARAVRASIFTEGNDAEELRENAREAVRCHFGDAAPGVVRLHFVRDDVVEDI